MRISYRQGDQGWGAVSLQLGGVVLDRRVSYLSEPLVEMAEIARHLLDPNYGCDKNTVIFADEPGAIVLRILQADSGDPRGVRLPSKIYNSGIITYNDAEASTMQLRLTVEEVEDAMSIEAGPGVMLAAEEISSKEFAESVFACLEGVFQVETVWSFYRKNIEAPFPLTEFAILGAMLGKEPRVGRIW